MAAHLPHDTQNTITALLREVFLGVEINSPTPDQPYPGFQISINNEAAAVRIIADFNDIITAHGVGAQTGSFIFHRGHICIDEQMAAEPNFFDALRDREFRIDVKDSLQEKPRDATYSIAKGMVFNSLEDSLYRFGPHGKLYVGRRPASQYPPGDELEAEAGAWSALASRINADRRQGVALRTSSMPSDRQAAMAILAFDSTIESPEIDLLRKASQPLREDALSRSFAYAENKGARIVTITDFANNLRSFFNSHKRLRQSLEASIERGTPDAGPRQP